MMKIIDGNNACAEMSYNFTETAFIYPITPSSPMASKIDDLKKIIEDAENDITNYTPEAVLKHKEKANNSTTEQSKLQIETAKLEALLNNLNARKRNLTNISSKHSNEYDLIKNFKPVERVFNGDVYKFDVNSELKNLDNLDFLL